MTEMKKRMVGLVLGLVLVFGLAGCGNSAEPKQEDIQTQQEQEETEEEDNIEYKEFEYYYAADVFDSDKVIPCDLDGLSLEGIYCGDWELKGSIDLYARREGGVAKVGYTKENIPVNVYLSDEEWIQLYFENEEEDAFKIIKVEDFLANSNYSPEAAKNNIVTEEPAETEEFFTYDYDEILETVGFDKNKEYTRDEYVEVLTKIFEAMGKTYNKEMETMNPMDDYDGFHLQVILGITEYTEETARNCMNYVEYGKDGYGGITEFCILKDTNKNDGTEGLNIFVKVDHEEHQKNIDAGY